MTRVGALRYAAETASPGIVVPRTLVRLVLLLMLLSSCLTAIKPEGGRCLRDGDCPPGMMCLNNICQDYVRRMGR